MPGSSDLCVAVQAVSEEVSEATQFLREYGEQAADMCYRVKAAQWAYSTNITNPNKIRMVGTATNVIYLQDNESDVHLLTHCPIFT